MAVVLTIFAVIAVVILGYVWVLIAASRHRSRAYRAIGRTKAGAVWMILLTGWTLADPIASLLVAAAILWSSWSLLRESFRLSLDAVPA